MAVPRRWALHLVSATLLAILLGMIGNAVAVLVSGAAAPTVAVRVTEAFDGGYHTLFTAADGTACDIYLHDRPGTVVAGQRVTVRTAGWPGACDHVWDTADRWWWLDYVQAVVFLSGVAAFIFIAWRRPDTLGRWALRRDGWSRPSR